MKLITNGQIDTIFTDASKTNKNVLFTSLTYGRSVWNISRL